MRLQLLHGDIMATNPIWRMTRQEWEACFADWIDNPNPKALLNASIFFDLDGVYGRLKWAEQLNGFIVRRARRNNRFLACLARNALNRTPPLGFFKSFVMEKDGRHNNSINLKRRGTAPLADLIRVHALAVGSRAQNSFERLDDIIDAAFCPKAADRICVMRWSSFPWCVSAIKRLMLKIILSQTTTSNQKICRNLSAVILKMRFKFSVTRRIF